MKTALVGKNILAPALFPSVCPDSLPHQNQNVLHQEKFAGTLLIRRLLISRGRRADDELSISTVPHLNVRKIVIWISGLVILASVAIICCVLIERHHPKRVFVTSSEKLYHEKLADDGIFSTINTSSQDERLFELRFQEWMTGRSPCVVFTRNRDKADFVISIDITQYFSPFLTSQGRLSADGNVLVLKRNGDVLLNESLSEYRGGGVENQIREQQLKRVREVLCPCCSKD